MKVKSSKFIVIFAIIFVCIFLLSKKTSVMAEDKNKGLQDEIESTLFTETEFFGTKTYLPFPTVEAKANLSKLSEKHPNEPKIFLQLARLNEKLADFEEAEENLKKYIEFSEDKIKSHETLVKFYHRRADFEKEAEVYEKILQIAPTDKCGIYFSNIIELARKNELEKYLEPEFYEKFLVENPENFDVLVTYVEKLITEKNTEKALKFIRESKVKFPERSEFFLEKEVSILPIIEAEKVYIEAFDYFSSGFSQNFYSFLSKNERLRVYGSKLRQKFEKDKSDFDAAIRLIHYRKNDGKYGNDDAITTILQLERAKTEKRQTFTSEELLTISRILLEEDNGDLASRFLYALFLRNDVKQKGEMRERVLYQIFEVFTKADSEKLPLSKGDLRFYEDIAKADSHPGISTGILSLIFSDANIGQKFKEKEDKAVRNFNLAAAYRIFQEYKREKPVSKELASMYLDIIRLYTAENKLEIAEKTLTEFEQNFEDSEDFPEVALKLAESYIVKGNFEKEREIYQKILDHIGNNREKSQILVSYSYETNDLTTINPNIFQTSNKQENENDFYYLQPSKYRDILGEAEEFVSYEEILQRLVSSLAKENKTKEILNVYTSEIKKYPDEQGLYEQLLQWFGRTNLTEQQLKTYREALTKFPTRSWQDRLARFFIRQEKYSEFEKFSREILASFDDAETETYLMNFVSQNPNLESFQDLVHLGLYALAHEKFPHNQAFIRGLLKFYENSKQDEKRRELLGKYYFESSEIREEFLQDLAKRGKLREFWFEANQKFSLNQEFKKIPYRLFYADASRKLSNFEEAVDTYKLLDKLYPNTPEFTEILINLTRSFGQTDKKILIQTAEISKHRADFSPTEKSERIHAGEVLAELGLYEKAKEEWNKLLEIESGNPETFLETATIHWDYFQFEEALQTIENLRRKLKNDEIYAFQAAAILEAQNKTDAALREYIKALGTEENFYRTKKLLTELYKREGFPAKIQKAFEAEKHNPHVIIGFANVLAEIDSDKALQIVRSEIKHQNSNQFLSEALSIFRNFDDRKGEQTALQKLALRNKGSRKAISFELQIAESFLSENNKTQTIRTLQNLIDKYPTNYGVLDETADFYWRIGERSKTINILQTGMNRGVGKFRYQFGRNLAKRLREDNQYFKAEDVLLQFFNENKTDAEVFRELTTLYVLSQKPENLQKITKEAFAELKKQDLDPRELKYELIERRRNLIEAFTNLKDTDAAIEQYIEIINLEPEESENISDAIRFAKRYGGSEKLLDYYQKTAEASFKNYRWFMVLARIYEADDDFQKAAENYNIAIHNQPELPELREALLENYLQSKSFEKALETVNGLIALTNGRTVYIRQKLEVLKKLGRFAEAETEKKKLPLREQKILTEEENKVASNSQNIDERKEKSIENYRKFFAGLNENPFKTALKSSDLNGYIEKIRQVENLDKIFRDFWKLRSKIIAEIENSDSTNVGKGRDLLGTIDGSLPNSIGRIAHTKATHEELAALFQDFEQKIREVKSESNKHGTLSILENLIRECGFTDLEEIILHAKKQEAFNTKNTENYRRSLNKILDFYEKRGDFYKSLEILEAEKSDDLQSDLLTAKYAKLLNKPEKEIAALEKYFQKTPETPDKRDENLERFFTLLYENRKEKIAQLAENNRKHRIQFINFLIEKGEKVLTHKAIASSNFTKNWKLKRNAETSFIFKEFEKENERYFAEVLQIAPVGEMLGQKPNLTQKEFYELSAIFGKWLYLADEKDFAEAFLPARTEYRSKDFAEYLSLGKFYYSQKNFRQALAYFQFALELNPTDKKVFEYLGNAYFQTGETKKAEEFWTKIIKENPTQNDLESFLKILAENGQAEKARNVLKKIILNDLRSEDYDYYGNKRTKLIADLPKVLQKLAETFRSETEKAKYFLELCLAASDSKILSETVIENDLIEPKNLIPFYKILIQRSVGLNSSDYSFSSFAEKYFDAEKAELLYEQENEGEIFEPESEKLRWQKELLEMLLTQKKSDEAKSLMREIENSLTKRFVRPNWLRIAEIKTSVLENDKQKAFIKARKFIGIEIPEESKAFDLPNLERLNLVLEVFTDKRDIAQLKREFYARNLALESFEPSAFIESARIAFGENDAETGRKFLALMCKIARGKETETSQKELAEMPLIKPFAKDAGKFVKEMALTNLNYAEALKRAAEVSAEFGLLEEAKNYRAKLVEIDAKDAENRIEYARLSAELGKRVEALEHLAFVIGNRNANQTERWQAALIASEITKSDETLRERIKEKLKLLAKRESEIFRLIENETSFSQVNEIYESPFWKYLRARASLSNNDFQSALRDFAAISKEEKVWQSFGFLYEQPTSQMIRIYAQNENHLAALKLAEDFDFSANNFQSVFPTLQQQTQNFRTKSDLEVLALLSKAAEKANDLLQAIEFENRRMARFENSEELKAARERIARLKMKMNESEKASNLLGDK